ncbi:hypothetical protein D3C84_1206790 [compost metagenome]
MLARQAAVIRAVADFAVYLSRQHVRRALIIAERLPDNAFRFALRIDVSRIEEVDA